MAEDPGCGGPTLILQPTQPTQVIKILLQDNIIVILLYSGETFKGENFHGSIESEHFTEKISWNTKSFVLVCGMLKFLLVAVKHSENFLL